MNAFALIPQARCEDCGAVLYEHESTYCSVCAEREAANDDDHDDRRDGERCGR